MLHHSDLFALLLLLLLLLILLLLLLLLLLLTTLNCEYVTTYCMQFGRSGRMRLYVYAMGCLRRCDDAIGLESDAMAEGFRDAIGVVYSYMV